MTVTTTTTTATMDPSTLSTLLLTDPLILAVTASVRSYMAAYDASHDFNHIQRVVGLALTIYHHHSPSTNCDPRVIVLAALLHDVGDRKYVKSSDGDPATLVYRQLRAHGAFEALAQTVQTICLGVSYSSEIKDPERVRRLIAQHPELAVVQDADRLDAIGAVGIGRLFTYGAAKTDRPMDDSMEHMDEKLFKLESMMKTPHGRKLARERTRRMEEFKAWWQEETEAAKGLLDGV